MKYIKVTLTFLFVSALILFYVYSYWLGERAAFKDIRFANGKVFVELENEVYEWVSAESFPMDSLVNFSKQRFGVKWKHRIKDDYMWLMRELGEFAFFSTRVELRNSLGHLENYTLNLTKENRTHIRLRTYENQKIKRPHVKVDSLVFPSLTLRLKDHKPPVIKTNEADKNPWIIRSKAISAIENLEYILEENYSYLEHSGFNYRKGIDKIISDLGTGIYYSDLALQIRKLLAFFGDGHTRLPSQSLGIDSLYLPFEIKKVNEGYIATNGGNLLNTEYPYIVSINGKKIRELQKVVGELIADGSPQFQEYGELKRLQSFTYIQKRYGFSTKKFRYTLHNKKDTITYEGSFISRKEMKEKRSRLQSFHKRLDENFGYLYLHKMEKDDDYQSWLDDVMEEFKETKGIIIDLRGNGGGSRKPIYTLLPYFLHKPKVINVNVLRINEEDDPHITRAYGGLEKRFSYPIDWEGWSDDERKAINQFKFTPDWNYPKNKFSKLHYSVVSPNGAYYSKPVIVLMDESNFSASDIFLGAFKGVDNVTLLGRTSSGGSGFTQVRYLSESGHLFLASTIASFQPNGKLYEKNGVEPDIFFNHSIDSYLYKKDLMLEKGLSLLKSMLKN